MDNFGQLIMVHVGELIGFIVTIFFAALHAERRLTRMEEHIRFLSVQIKDLKRAAEGRPYG